MSNDDHGPIAAEPSVRISVHVDDIDPVPPNQVDEPVSACCKIDISGCHPFKAVVTLDKRYIFEFADGIALSLNRTRSHSCQHETGFGHGAAQVSRIGPDSADG